MSATYEVDTRRLNRILHNLDGNVEQALRAIGMDIEAAAKGNSPVETGALQSSIYTATEKQNSFPSVDTEADRVVLPTPRKGEAYVGPSVDYGIHVELGTRFAAAQPYLLPAVRAVEGTLARRFERVVTD
jgi:HK97 gp10 family phage protein